jgi:fatty-acid desaturase
VLPNIVQITIFWIVQASALLVFTVPFRWPLVGLWAVSHFLRAGRHCFNCGEYHHQRFQRAARNGFYWWEYDLTWYTIRAMAAVGLVWDIQAVPTRIYEEARAVKSRRAVAAVPSVVDVSTIALELAEEPE